MPAALDRACHICLCYSPPCPTRRRVPAVVSRGISRSVSAATCSCSSAAAASLSAGAGRWSGRCRRPSFNSLVRMEALLSRRVQLICYIGIGLWVRGYIDKNKGLVEHLQQYGIVKSSEVAEVMQTIDRGLFVPDATAAYIDSPMPIGYNATISAPHMHATCLELLKDHLQPGMRALDIGSGTGYLTACFAMMVGPQGRAVGVEHIPELVASSLENVKKSAAAELLKEGSLSFHVADGRFGLPELAPFDAIHVGAAAPEIPQALIQQLKPGGRMVIPVGNFFQELKVVEKKLDGSISSYDEASVRYVPLTSRASQLQRY